MANKVIVKHLDGLGKSWLGLIKTQTSLAALCQEMNSCMKARRATHHMHTLPTTGYIASSGSDERNIRGAESPSMDIIIRGTGLLYSVF